MLVLPAMPQTVSFQGFVWAMYQNARWQLENHQFAAAVLLSQVSLEMGARNAFTTLLVQRDGPLDDKVLKETVPDFSFMDEGTKRLWTDLTGASVTAEPKCVWKAYHRHVERRNRIAHGLAWGDVGAEESWLAVGRMITRLDETLARTQGRPGSV